MFGQLQLRLIICIAFLALDILSGGTHSQVQAADRREKGAEQPVAISAGDPPKTQIVANRSTGSFRDFRKMICGPDTNQHERYPGCTGFVGWASVKRLHDGDLVCAFSAGYWHVSFPTPFDVDPNLLRQYQEVGFPREINAPTGGRILWCRSADDGQSWTRPVTLVDTPEDDRHPNIAELADGTLVCTFFTINSWYGYTEPPAGRGKNSRVASIRSRDGGKTWSDPTFVPSPFKYYDRTSGNPVILPSGKILLPTYGEDAYKEPTELGLYVSNDGAVSWEFVSRLKSSVQEIDEPSIAVTKDDTLLMISRPDAEVAISSDHGLHWTRPHPLGFKMDAPCLIPLRDGTLACLFGWIPTGGIQVTWSTDSGHTWAVPAADRGFQIDNSVYAYVTGCELSDGSIYAVYYDPCGNQTKTALWALRFKIREDRQGIDLLPIGGDCNTPSAKITDPKPKSTGKPLDVDAIKK